MEILADGVPGIEVTSSAVPPSTPANPPDVAIISQALESGPVLAWLDALEAAEERPQVLLISSDENRWSEQSVRSSRADQQLEKSGGIEFVKALVRAVARTASSSSKGRLPVIPKAKAHTEKTKEAPRGASLAILHVDKGGRLVSASADSASVLKIDEAELTPGCAVDELLGVVWRQLPRGSWGVLGEEGSLAARMIKIGDEGFVLLALDSEADPDLPEALGGLTTRNTLIGHRHSVVTGVLTQELREILDVLDSLAALMNAGREGGEGLWARSRYGASLSRELLRAQAIVHRLEAIHAPARTSLRSYRLELDDLISLRADAWRLFQREQVRLELDLGRKPTGVRVAPGVLGPVIDALVDAHLSSVEPDGTVIVSAGRVSLDETFTRACPGLRAGAYARVRIAASVGDSLRSHGREEPRPIDRSLTELGIAAVKAHGGYLRSSRKKAVSRSDFFLPAERTLPGVTPDREPSVLVVDDEERVRNISAEILRQAGCRVVVVGSGEEAVNLYLAGCRYDLVLLDFAMDGIDGSETFDYLRAADPGIRAVLCTGTPSSDGVVRMFEKGLLGLLLKPFRMSKLLDVTRAALGRPLLRPAAPLETQRN